MERLHAVRNDLAMTTKKFILHGRRMFIWVPGKWVRFVSFSFPRAQSGMIESLAVPERMESLPFH